MRMQPKWTCSNAPSSHDYLIQTFLILIKYILFVPPHFSVVQTAKAIIEALDDARVRWEALRASSVAPTAGAVPLRKAGPARSPLALAALQASPAAGGLLSRAGSGLAPTTSGLYSFGSPLSQRDEGRPSALKSNPPAPMVILVGNGLVTRLQLAQVQTSEQLQQKFVQRRGSGAASSGGSQRERSSAVSFDDVSERLDPSLAAWAELQSLASSSQAGPGPGAGGSSRRGLASSLLRAGGSDRSGVLREADAAEGLDIWGNRQSPFRLGAVQGDPSLSRGGPASSSGSVEGRSALQRPYCQAPGSMRTPADMAADAKQAVDAGTPRAQRGQPGPLMSSSYGSPLSAGFAPSTSSQRSYYPGGGGAFVAAARQHQLSHGARRMLASGDGDDDGEGAGTQAAPASDGWAGVAKPSLRKSVPVKQKAQQQMFNSAPAGSLAQVCADVNSARSPTITVVKRLMGPLRPPRGFGNSAGPDGGSVRDSVDAPGGAARLPLSPRRLPPVKALVGSSLKDTSAYGDSRSPEASGGSSPMWNAMVVVAEGQSYRPNFQSESVCFEEPDPQPQKSSALSRLLDKTAVRGRRPHK